MALVNDVTMLPVASDNASPSAWPEIPSMPQILLAAFLRLGQAIDTAGLVFDVFAVVSASCDLIGRETH